MTRCVRYCDVIRRAGHWVARHFERSDFRGRFGLRTRLSDSRISVSATSFAFAAKICDSSQATGSCPVFSIARSKSLRIELNFLFVIITALAKDREVLVNESPPTRWFDLDPRVRQPLSQRDCRDRFLRNKLARQRGNWLGESLSHASPPFTLNRTSRELQPLTSPSSNSSPKTPTDPPPPRSIC